MKKLSFTLTILAALWLGGCQQSDLRPDDQIKAEPSLAQVPQGVLNAIRSAYPAATELTASELDKGKVWEIRFRVGGVVHQAKVDVKGVILEAYAQDGASGRVASSLPAAAQEFLQKTYPGFVLVDVAEGQMNNQKAFKVFIRKEREEVTLVFDEKGAVLLEYRATAQPAQDAPRHYPVNQVEDLPEPIRNYLNQNGLTFGKGMVSIDKDDKRSYFLMAKKGEQLFELTFDGSGNLQKSTLINRPGAVTPGTDNPSNFVQKPLRTAEELPAVIVDHLNTTYSGWTYMKGYVNLVSNKPTDYLIVIKAGESLYYLKFTGEGKLEAVEKA